MSGQRTVDAEALATLQRYIRINTSVPPGDVTKAADLLAGILEREGIPAKRFGTPDELGALCAFLCSAQAGYITCQSIMIDGGVVNATF